MVGKQLIDWFQESPYVALMSQIYAKAPDLTD